MNEQHTCIIIGGPTAVGKTKVAIELARYFSTEIISADSRQCFRELNIGVARPTAQELHAVPHHFIATHSITDEVNAATFERFALKTAEQLFEKYPVVIMTGGTGLYIKAFAEGLNEVPAALPEIREKWSEVFKVNGIEGLQKEIQKLDPRFYNSGEIQNPRRIQRALEVIEQTGKSILSFHVGQPISRPFNIIKVALELPREELNNRINERVNIMMSSGLLDEVKKLYKHKNLNALQTVGYKELFDYLDEKITLPEAVALIKQNTRKYAKRQMTWFKNDPVWHWCKPDIEEVKQYCQTVPDKKYP